MTIQNLIEKLQEFINNELPEDTEIVRYIGEDPRIGEEEICGDITSIEYRDGRILLYGDIL